jgi:hypothetical protein
MKILTPTGYQPYYKIQKKTADCIKIVFTDGTSITCSKDHRFACYDYKSLNINEYEIVAEKLRKGVTLEYGRRLGPKTVDNIIPMGVQTVYTPVMVQNGNKYIANGVVNYNCSFEGSYPTLVDGEILKTYLPSDPVTIKYNYAMNIYEEPQPGFVYVMGVDSSTGVGQDYCAFQVLKIVNHDLYEQVCVFKHNKIKPVDYAQIIAKTSEAYNNAMMIVENNDCGRYVTDELWYNIGCPNVMNTDGKGIGTRATPASKLDACMALKKVADAHKLILHDAETIYQLSRFEQISPNHFRGAKGCHDDLVSGLYWAVYCLSLPQFDLDAIQVSSPTTVVDDYAPPPCLFDESNDNTDFWKSFN